MDEIEYIKMKIKNEELRHTIKMLELNRECEFANKFKVGDNNINYIALQNEKSLSEAINILLEKANKL